MGRVLGARPSNRLSRSKCRPDRPAFGPALHRFGRRSRCTCMLLHCRETTLKVSCYRRARNRLSQRFFRERRKLHVQELENKVKAFAVTDDERNKLLGAENHRLRTSLVQTRKKMASLISAISDIDDRLKTLLDDSYAVGSHLDAQNREHSVWWHLLPPKFMLTHIQVATEDQSHRPRSRDETLRESSRHETLDAAQCLQGPSPVNAESQVPSSSNPPAHFAVPSNEPVGGNPSNQLMSPAPSQDHHSSISIVNPNPTQVPSAEFESVHEWHLNVDVDPGLLFAPAGDSSQSSGGSETSWENHIPTDHVNKDGGSPVTIGWLLAQNSTMSISWTQVLDIIMMSGRMSIAQAPAGDTASQMLYASPAFPPFRPFFFNLLKHMSGVLMSIACLSHVWPWR